MRDDLPPGHYILEGHTPVPCRDVVVWAKWMETADRHVGKTYVGKVWISTVFLTLDHNWYGSNHPPVLFETMVFGGGSVWDEAQVRYCTWAEAEAGHQDMVECVQAYVDRLQRYDALRLHDRYLRFPKPNRAPAWRPCSFL